MRITKIGHCCLLIKIDGLRILTDPGSYSTDQVDLENINAILITHEHEDHLHIKSLKEILENNPEAKIYTNSGVGKILEKEGIEYTLLEHGQSTSVEGVEIEGFGEDHAYIYETVTAVKNTGYFIGRRFFYPGDAFYNPGREIDVLALPVAGPWMKISEAIDYAKEINPRVCFPVHDGMLQTDHRRGPVFRLPKSVLEPLGIKFVEMTSGSIEEF